MNADALRVALEAWGLGPEWTAHRAAALSLAGMVDERPDDTDLWREYRLMLKALVDGAGGGEEPDAFDEWLRAQMVDSADGPSDAGRSGGGVR